MKNLLRIAFLILIISTSGFDFAVAQIPGVTITPGTNLINGNWSLGWQFSTNVPLTISALGAYDEGANGLNSSHEVGLYTEAGVLLASVTVPAGTGATLNGNFRYVNIAAIVIPVGTYRIAAVYLLAGGDNYGSDNTYSNHPNVTYLNSRFTASATLVYPSTISLVTFPTFAFASGNFLGSAAVPTLGEWGIFNFGLLLLSMATIFIVSRQRKLKLINGMQLEISDQFSMGSIFNQLRSNGRMFFFTLLSVLATFTLIFGIATTVGQYQMTSADIPGSIVASLIISILIQFILINRRK